MTEIEIEIGLQEILSSRLSISPEKILRISHFKNDLGMDSFGAIEVMFEVEDKFSINVNEKDLLNIKTVQDMINYIVDKLDKKNSTN